MSIIFVFVDGIGLTNATVQNPFGVTPQPYLSQLIDGPLLIDRVGQYPRARLSAIDATLDWPGLPQSGTGQTSLFMGINAAHAVQRHQSHFPPPALHDALRSDNLLTLAKPFGTSAFANAFDAGFWQAIETRKLRRSASVIASEGAGVRFRDVTDLANGHALSWDITNQVMHERHPDLIATIDAFAAGKHLALLARPHIITLYETFLTDLVGHGRTDITTADVVTRIDGLIGGIVAHLRPCDTLVISSDHGNFEAPHEKGHTTNPVPLLVVGADCDTLHNIESISAVAPALVARYPYHREAGQ